MRPEARFGPVPMHPAKQTEGIIFPKLSAEDERQLAQRSCHLSWRVLYNSPIGVT